MWITVWFLQTILSTGVQLDGFWSILLLHSLCSTNTLIKPETMCSRESHSFMFFTKQTENSHKHPSFPSFSQPIVDFALMPVAVSVSYNYVIWKFVCINNLHCLSAQIHLSLVTKQWSIQSAHLLSHDEKDAIAHFTWFGGWHVWPCVIHHCGACVVWQRKVITGHDWGEELKAKSKCFGNVLN